MRFDSPVSVLRGIGPKLGRALAETGIECVADLLGYLPYRYEDRSLCRPLAALVPDTGPISVWARVAGVRLIRPRGGGVTVIEARLTDGSGNLTAVWFNQPYLARQLTPGRALWLFGVVSARRRGSGVEMVSPEWEVAEEGDRPRHMGRIVAMYRRVGPVSGRRLRMLVREALRLVDEGEDALPALLGGEADVPSLAQAYRDIHEPREIPVPPAFGGVEPPNPAVATAGCRRLALEELLARCVDLAMERRRRLDRRAVQVNITRALQERVRTFLPFSLTAAQRRVVREIADDLRQPHPMARLLQGDVGSGKTVIAALAALMVLEAGRQVAVLAPTEVLARQHFRTFSRWLSCLGHDPLLLVGETPERERRSLRSALARREPRLVVGTHALLEESVQVPALGLAIVDEQHRFGVEQWRSFLAKGPATHALMMTATPIPRTVALTVYGDLDVSRLDEMPAGRVPVKTVIRGMDAVPALVRFLVGETRQGGRVFWVMPAIEGDEERDRPGVEERASALRRALPGVVVAELHGRMDPGRRDEGLTGFARGDVSVLCATTVVEVGVDVPEATVMVVEQAHRFGLAQLHQLRGRVGRGTRASICVALVPADIPGVAMERLRLFAGTRDGFALAEADLALRGPGELAGLRQWGKPDFRFADLVWHQEELTLAQAVVSRAEAQGTLEALAGLLGVRGRGLGTSNSEWGGSQ